MLYLDTSAIVQYANTLDKLQKTAYPNAIRGTLNNAAFHLKTSSMPNSAADHFENRQKNFFKANSRFFKATGFNISQMKSIVGFIPTGLKGENNFSIQDLEEQEFGGTIQKKSFIPMRTARAGNSNSKLVRNPNRLSAINKIIDSKKMTGRNDREKFKKSVYIAGVNGFVLGNRNPQILWRVNSLRRSGALPYKLTPLYTFKKGRSVTVGATGFMEQAATITRDMMTDDFIKEAERQIKKYTK